MHIKMLKRALVGLVFSVSGFANAGLVMTDISGTATDGLYTYYEGGLGDSLGVGRDFWEITTLSSNQLLFETIINVGFATAEVDLFGLEANDDWISASITGTNGVPFLTYSGGDTAKISFPGGGQWFIGDTITITFDSANPVPEPSTVAIFALSIMGLASRRFKKQ